MLDSATKRRIDTARDILVGKVPDPKSQVEQITIALIYKFMDDMDAESEELGGQRKFFAGDFVRYGWAKLMRSGLGGHETLNLYAEAITRMPENPGIPPLFRDIFKNAFLPYRDPETLRAFLKVIDEFEYDHSERLGDAFEYLLSVLGSQGEAGQFRTPRHIIDFMVAIVDPKKDETVLDPACGTAGFLISAYKHILRANSTSQAIGPNGEDNGAETALHTSKIPSAKGDLLSPDERGRLAENFRGYDISPDMVRLSLVNMYLHGFASPHIYEYDTLTSQDRWNEHADVILANPPFMSPKGGIKPHNRFSVQSKRSEVLFVDYMAEHLTPSGRAAIIVPEGIIFQSQTAYKQLRKMLVEEYLVAVISLPAGVFQPYSGVKTSILILDKSLAKKADTIDFFKVENDGFDLGAQRRPIDKNDLPEVQDQIGEYLCRLQAGQTLENFQPALGLFIEKARVASNGDFSLSRERYRVVANRVSHHPVVRIGEVCDLIGGGTPSKRNPIYWLNGSVKWISSKHINERGLISGYELITKQALDETATRLAPQGSTIIITRVSVGKHGIADDDYAINQDLTALVPKDTEGLSSEFLRCMASRIALVVEEAAEGTGVRGVTRDFLGQLLIPLPPIEVQREIVEEIEGYQRVIDGARAVVENYRPHVPVDPEWPLVRLGDALRTSSGGTPSRGRAEYYNGGTIPWVKSGEVAQGVVTRTEESITEAALRNSSAKVFPVGTVLVAMYGATAGQVGLLGIGAATNQAVCGILPDQAYVPTFLYYHLRGRTDEMVGLSTGGAQPNISQAIIRALKIPRPPISAQEAIVAEIEAEQALVAANRELIGRFEKKIQATLARVWGDDGTTTDEIEA